VDSIIAPTRIRLGEADDQFLDFRIDTRSTGVATVFRSVELLCDEFPEPLEYRVGIDNRAHVRESLPSESLPDLRQADSFFIGESQTSFQPGFQNIENLVLRCELLVSKEDFFFDMTTDERQHFLTFHRLHLSPPVNDSKTGRSIRKAQNDNLRCVVRVAERYPGAATKVEMSLPVSASKIRTSPL